MYFLTQKQIHTILNSYSCRAKEFQPWGHLEYDKLMYQSSVIKGFAIVIHKGEYMSDDIHVDLTNRKGKRSVTDVWKIINEVPEFVCRCMPNTVIDSDIIVDLKKEICSLEDQIKGLKDYINGVSKNEIKNDTVKKRGKGRPKLEDQKIIRIQMDLRNGLSIRKIAEKYHDIVLFYIYSRYFLICRSALSLHCHLRFQKSF